MTCVNNVDREGLEVQYQEPGCRWSILQLAHHPSIRGRSRYRRGTGSKSSIGSLHLKSTGRTDALSCRRCKRKTSKMSTRSTKGGQYEDISEGTITYEVGRARVYLKGKVLAIAAHSDSGCVNAGTKVRQYNDAREGNNKESYWRKAPTISSSNGKATVAEKDDGDIKD
jgi:hypothetical protein